MKNKIKVEIETEIDNGKIVRSREYEISEKFAEEISLNETSDNFLRQVGNYVAMCEKNSVPS